MMLRKEEHAVKVLRCCVRGPCLKTSAKVDIVVSFSLHLTCSMGFQPCHNLKTAFGLQCISANDARPLSLIPSPAASCSNTLILRIRACYISLNILCHLNMLKVSYSTRLRRDLHILPLLGLETLLHLKTALMFRWRQTNLQSLVPLVASGRFCRSLLCGLPHTIPRSTQPDQPIVRIARTADCQSCIHGESRL